MATGGSEGPENGTPRPALGILKALRKLPPPSSQSGLGPMPVLTRSSPRTPPEHEPEPDAGPATPNLDLASSTGLDRELERGPERETPDQDPTPQPAGPAPRDAHADSVDEPALERREDDDLEDNDLDEDPEPVATATSDAPTRIKHTQEISRGSGIPNVIDRSLEATPPVAIRALDPLFAPAASSAASSTALSAASYTALSAASSTSLSAASSTSLATVPSPVAPMDGDGTDHERTARTNETIERGEGVPSQIGRFTVLKLLGSGGMGEVYAAYDPDLDRRVALKVLHAQVSQSSSSSTARARLLREAKALAKLSHPNVVAIYDVGTVDEQIFIAMEFVKGMTLTKWMRNPPEPLADGTQATHRAWLDVLALFLQAGRGMAAAHKAGIIHRDFKPDNVLMGRDGRVRVVDFGLARADGQPERPDTFADTIKSLASASSAVFNLRLTRTGGMAGTPAYMAPEQYLNLQVDARTDQFSYCVALYEGLYGERPFRGDTVARVRKAVINGEIVDAPKESAVPLWLRNILLRGLSVHPGSRYPSMDALLAELSDDPGRPQQSWLKAGMVVAAGLMIGAFGFFQLRAPDEGRLLDASACSGEAAAAPLAQAYGPALEHELEAHFASSGLADANQTWRRVDDLLDEMTAEIALTLRSVCTLDHLRGDTPNAYVDRQHACLARRLGPLSALSEALGELVPQDHGHAIPAAHALLGMTPCSDPSSLQVRADTPEDPELRELNSRLRRDLDRARATAWLGRLAEALASARQVSAEAGHTEGDSSAIRGEAYLLQGELEEQLGDYEGAERSLGEALWHAEASRHDEVAIDSLTVLVRVLGLHLGRHDDADALTPRLTAAVIRLGDRRRDARAQHSLGIAEAARGHTDASIVRLENAIATAQVIGGSYGRLLGALIRVDLGRALAQAGRVDEALDHHQQAVNALESTMGTNHPAVARGTLALCETWVIKGEIARALRTCHRGLELRTEASVSGAQKAEARFALARVTHLAKRHDEAIAGARKAIAEIDGDPAGRALRKQITKWLREHGR